MTVEDIRNKEFAKKVRGYHDAEVDDFLDAVAAEFCAVLKRSVALEERVKSLEAELSYLKSLETTLRDTLVTAQYSAGETNQRAQRSAAMIVQSAEDQSCEMLADAQRKADQIERATRETAAQFDAFRQEAIMVMRRQIEILSQALQHRM